MAKEQESELGGLGRQVWPTGSMREKGNSLTQPQHLSIKSILPNRENINLTSEVSFPFAIKYFLFEKKK